MRFRFGAVAVAVLCFATNASAIATYSYTGNNFTTINDSGLSPGSYDTGMSVSGTITLTAPLASNLANADISASVISFSFTDGRQTFTEADSLASANFWSFSTDGTGAITAWLIDLKDVLSPPRRILTQNRIIGEIVAIEDSGFLDFDLGQILDNPGTWTATIPEASTSLLLGMGLLGIAIRRRCA